MKIILALLVAAAVNSASAGYQYLRESPRPVRDTGPLWLYGDDVPRAPATGDHPILPQYIDDIKLDPNRRTVRSLSTPSAPGGHHPGDSRSGGGHRGGHDTGTRLGPNQRYARSVEHHERHARDVGDLFKKPSHRDVIIPNWNPHIKSSPWDSLRPRH